MESKTIFDITKYVPTLGIRPSLMRALEFLPDLTKDNMTPVVLLAPWLKSKNLETAVKKFETAFPDRNYVLDIDWDYKPTNEEQEAQSHWISLSNPNDSYSNWQLFWKECKRVIPCLQLKGLDDHNIKLQIQNIRSENRMFCVRVNVFEISPEFYNVIQILSDGTSDFVIVVEGGWIDDPLKIQQDIETLFNEQFSKITGDVPYVISCNSIPKKFTNINGIREIEFSNYRLVENLRRKFNNKRVIYGDWGSANPRGGGGGSPPPARIDYPLLNSWVIARNPEKNWNYKDAATEIINHESWSGKLNIYGEDLIKFTSGIVVGDGQKIDTPTKNVISRVNIHMHRQALRSMDSIEGISFDDDWDDHL